MVSVGKIEFFCTSTFQSDSLANLKLIQSKASYNSNSRTHNTSAHQCPMWSKGFKSVIMPDKKLYLLSENT